MAKKIDSETDFLEEFPEKTVNIEEKAASNKIKVRIYNKVKNTLFLEDDKGNLYRVPADGKYQASKIGDILFL